jgi:Carboxypeptidase regulatory-like domain
MRLAILTILLLTTVSLAPADACTCAPPRSLCAMYWRLAAAFAGTVREIREVPERPGMLAVHFDVDQRGPGVNSSIVVVESVPQNGFNCGYTFTVGQRYVVYAQSTPGGQLTTDMCSGTKLAAGAAVDLAFLKEITGPPRGVRVFGHVRRVEYDLVSFNRHDYGGVAGAHVQLIGDGGSREATTGADGEYDFRDLPAGTYKVTVTPPKGLALAGPPLPREQHHPPPPWSVTLTHPSECAEVWTWPRTDAQISGVLLNSNGRPADDEEIDLIAADIGTRGDKEIPHVSVRTNADGRFTFAFIPPGTYLVGVNLKNPPPASHVDHRSYHPGVTDSSKATVVTISPGNRLQLTPFQLPQWAKERRISGVVVWNDGSPAPEAQLTLTGARSERVPLDATGHFSLILPLGAQFTLTAQGTRIVEGRRVSGNFTFLQIGRQDRDADITIILKTVQ